MSSGTVLDGTQPQTSVSFIVPALNEEVNLRDTVDEIRRAAVVLSDFEIVIVNDGSTDATGAIADDLASKDAKVRAVHNLKNAGLGGAYKSGLAAASKSYVIMIPGDNNHPADGIIPILACAGKADIVIPYVANPEVRGPMRRAISRLFVILVNLLFGLNVRYYNGLVLHRLDLLRQITIETNGFAYQAEALVKLLKRGASYHQIPVPVADHGDRNTRAFRIRNVIRVVRTLAKLFIEVRVRA